MARPSIRRAGPTGVVRAPDRSDLPVVERPAPAEERPALTAAWNAVRAAIRASDRFRADVARHHGLDPSSTTALALLATSQPLTARQLGERVGLTPPGVTALLDRLEAAGMATRESNPTDRRKTMITLTVHGLATLHEIQRSTVTALATLSDERLGTTTSVLDQLAEVLCAHSAAMTGEPGPGSDTGSGAGSGAQASVTPIRPGVDAEYDISTDVIDSYRLTGRRRPQPGPRPRPLP